MKVQVGRVLRAHGVRGWVRIGGSDALVDARRLTVGGVDYEVEQSQRERADFLFKLKGCDDRNGSEALRGSAVELPRDELPALAPDEVYVADLVGCEVFDVAGTRLGAVTGTFPGGGHEILEVRGAKEFMLPFTPPILVGVDMKSRRITCDPPPGLIDLDEAE